MASKDPERGPEFRKNQGLEDLLSEINSLLAQPEESLLREGKLPYPPVLIMGPPRSGTTLFLQWLAGLGAFSYPTNLLSRFYGAPIIGAKIQLLLTNPRYNFREELADLQGGLDFHSENGKTRGALAPNEFWYFWRRFLPEPDRDVWTDPELREGMDAQRLVRELAGMMETLEKPLAAKAMLFNYNIPFLGEILDKAVFVHMKRDEASNAISALEARKRQFGTEEPWYSFRISEYERLKDLSPLEQVVGQVHYINRAVERGLAGVWEEKRLTVQYEDFCKDPGRIYEQLRQRLESQGHRIPPNYEGPPGFRPTRLNAKDESVSEAVQLFKQKGSPKFGGYFFGE